MYGQFNKFFIVNIINVHRDIEIRKKNTNTILHCSYVQLNVYAQWILQKLHKVKTNTLVYWFSRRLGVKKRYFKDDLVEKICCRDIFLFCCFSFFLNYLNFVIRNVFNQLYQTFSCCCNLFKLFQHLNINNLFFAAFTYYILS